MAQVSPNQPKTQLTYSLILLIDHVPAYELSLRSPPTSALHILHHIRQQLIALPNLVLFSDQKCSKQVTSDSIVTNGQHFFASVTLENLQQEIRSWFLEGKESPPPVLHQEKLKQDETQPTKMSKHEIPIKQEPKKQVQNGLRSEIVQLPHQQSSIPQKHAVIYPQVPPSNKNGIPESRGEKIVHQQSRRQAPQMSPGPTKVLETTENSMLDTHYVQASPPVTSHSCCSLI